MISPVHLAHPAHSAHLRRPATLINSNPNANLNHLLSFSSASSPQQKGGFFQKKVIPVVRRVGAAAGKISDVAGKVAVVASIL
jgi:hypothetical protein